MMSRTRSKRFPFSVTLPRRWFMVKSKTVMRDLAEAFGRPIFESIGRAITDAITRWVLAGQADAAEVVDGRSVARYCRRMIVAAAVGVGASAMFTILALTAPGNAKWIALPFVLFTIACVLGLLDCVYARFEFNREELFVQSFWKGRRLVPWSAVQGLGYSMWGYRVIHAGDYGDISVSQYLSGSRALIDLVKARVSEHMVAEATMPGSAL
jgi:hypothetical protein